MTERAKIKPVLVLSTGRCGSTMVSEMLNKHPKVLSISEFFVPLGAHAFAHHHPDGERMWKTYSEQSPALHAMLKDGIVVSEGLYPHDDPKARFRAENMPPILAVTLPHLTQQFEELYDELGPVVRAQPRMELAEHYHFLFDYLRQKYGREVWVERSGGSLMHASKLLRLFPEARVIHVYRDGRETAMSMTHHHNFRVLLSAIKKLKAYGYNARKKFLQDKGSGVEAWLQDLIFRNLDIKKLLSTPLSLADYGAFWNEMILIGHQVFKDLPPDRLLNVKFEDVQDAPREKLQELIRFIDPSLDDAAWLDEVSAMLRPTRSKFNTLPEAEQRAVTAACEPGMKILGYC